MNDDKQLDSQLKALEARLAASPPKIESWEKDEILYACAFAEGKRVASRSLRLWQTTAAVMCVCFIGTAIPLGIAQLPNVERIAKTVTVPRRVRLPQPSETEPTPVAPPKVTPKLDAWQVTASEGDSLKGQLAQLAQLDAASRSSTVSALAQSVLITESKTH